MLIPFTFATAQKYELKFRDAMDRAMIEFIIEKEYRLLHEECYGRNELYRWDDDGGAQEQ